MKKNILISLFLILLLSKSVTGYGQAFCESNCYDSFNTKWTQATLEYSNALTQIWRDVAFNVMFSWGDYFIDGAPGYVGQVNGYYSLTGIWDYYNKIAEAENAYYNKVGQILDQLNYCLYLCTD